MSRTRPCSLKRHLPASAASALLWAFLGACAVLTLILSQAQPSLRRPTAAQGGVQRPRPVWTRAATFLDGAGPRDLLTIVLDRQRGDEKCVAFLHTLLPSWIRWRYVIVVDDDISALGIDTPALIVTRWIDPASAIVDWAVRHPHPVGLMLMADETDVQDASVYAAFDYVLRHYYFDTGATPPVRALGNMTCSAASTSSYSPAWPPAPPARHEPRLGLHWILLQPRGMGQLDSHHAPGSYWPASRRARPAVYIGSLRADRAEMVSVMRAAFPDADIQVEASFDGTVGPLDYSQVRLVESVFALIPAGNNAETHRLTEALDQGCIPVQIEAPFQTATFEPVPGIRARTWAEAVQRMRLLLDADPQQLDAVQAQVTDWWRRWKACATADLDRIFSATLSLK